MLYNLLIFSQYFWSRLSLFGQSRWGSKSSYTYINHTILSSSLSIHYIWYLSVKKNMMQTDLDFAMFRFHSRCNFLTNCSASFNICAANLCSISLSRRSCSASFTYMRHNHYSFCYKWQMFSRDSKCIVMHENWSIQKTQCAMKPVSSNRFRI